MSMRLMIAVPTTEYMPAGFVKSLCDLTTELNRQKVNYKVEIQSGTLVYIARNKLASTAVNEKYTHVLWLDSDMVFTSNIVDDLMFCGKEMVCGAFVSRRPPYGPCVYESIKKRQRSCCRRSSTSSGTASTRRTTTARTWRSAGGSARSEERSGANRRCGRGTSRTFRSMRGKRLFRGRNRRGKVSKCLRK